MLALALALDIYYNSAEKENILTNLNQHDFFF